MKEFEVYAMFDRDAVEALVDRVLVGVGLVKQQGCRTLCILDLTEGFEEVKVDAVAPGRSGSDECVHQSFRGGKEERWTEAGVVFLSERGLFGDVVGVVFQQEARIQNYTLVVEV